MTYSIYDSAIPPMIRMLQNLSNILDKAVAQSEIKNVSLAAMLEGRLAPDMFALPRQIQIVSDTAKGCAARLQGEDPPSFSDTETTFPELKARIEKTVAYLQGIVPGKFAGAEDRHIVLKLHTRTLEFSGADFVHNYALPNFYFHVVTAYGILRHLGIDVGKRDYLG
jgi:uncharacterized protein